MQLLTREQFRNLIGQVRGNGSFPDEPLLAVYDALWDLVKILEAKDQANNFSIPERQRQIDTLTAKLAEAKRERDALKCPDWQLVIRATDLQAQLAQAQETIARLEKERQAYKDAFSSANQMRFDIADLTEQLATLRASHTVMEETCKKFAECWSKP